jgi:hypothetical protein
VVPGQERQNAIRREPGKNHRPAHRSRALGRPKSAPGQTFIYVLQRADFERVANYRGPPGTLALPAARLRELSTSINEDKQAEQNLSAGDLRCGDREFTCVDSGNMWFLVRWRRTIRGASAARPEQQIA